MSVSVNTVLFHAVLDPANTTPALALNIVALIGYKHIFKGLLS